MNIYKVDAGFAYEGAYLSYLYKKLENAEAKLKELSNNDPEFDWVKTYVVKLEDEDEE